jgi:hypothetical protein
VKEGEGQVSDPSETTSNSRSWLRRLVKDHGGKTIFAFKLARCACVLALLVLYVLSFVKLAAGAENVFITTDGRIGAVLCATHVCPRFLYVILF